LFLFPFMFLCAFFFGFISFLCSSLFCSICIFLGKYQVFLMCVCRFISYQWTGCMPHILEETRN
jgi:hypothetical protein